MTLFVTFEQADSGLPAAVAIQAVEAVYAIEKEIANPNCMWCGHLQSDHAQRKQDRTTLEWACTAGSGEDRCDCRRSGWTPFRASESRTVIKTFTGRRYEVPDSVATVLGRIDAASGAGR